MTQQEVDRRENEASPSGVVRVSAVQMHCTWDLDGNVDRATQLVERAAAMGAQVVLLPELFQCPYFCAEQSAGHFALAAEAADSELIAHFSALAKALEVVLPLSFFERSGNAHFNSLVMIDACGTVLGVYRKSHIPDGPGYQEKFYFTPGDSGFRVFRTKYGVLGAGICWDQWYPESARSMVLQGAEILFYPTAIGSEPASPEVDTCGAWQRSMQGHAVSNAVPVVAANRWGHETFDDPDVHGPVFYGSSFVTDETGELLQQAPREGDAVLIADYDLAALRRNRAEWGFFRDRRPELYGALVTHDGKK